MLNATRLVVLVSVITALGGSHALGSEMVFSHYRGVTLGDGVQLVVSRLGASLGDVATVQTRPALVQRLTWRPRRFISGMTLEPDALAEMVLTFHMGRLTRIAVVYDRDRTAGLTDADLRASLSATYGTPWLSSSAAQSPAAASDSEPIGRWGDADTLIVMRREAYSGRVGLTITAVLEDQAMTSAMAEGARLDAAEAPARDLARREAETKARGDRDEAVRQSNKAAFTP